MGPTGSGKSSFIESLVPDQYLNISKDSLESVTQHVNCYQVVHLGVQPDYDDDDRLIILMDTPGFLDPRLSEDRITKMVTESLEAFRQNSSGCIVHILYFQPITDIRIGGSKRDAVKILQAYVKLYNAGNITVITTMWNNISNPKQLEDATRRLGTLKNEIYASSDNLKIEVAKFDTSQASTLSLLGGSYYGWVDQSINSGEAMNPHYQSLLCNNLLGRITTVLQQLQLLAEDKWSATCSGSEDRNLLEVVLRDEKVALLSLQSFLDDLVRIDRPGLTPESGADTSIFYNDISGLTCAGDKNVRSGIMALQCLLDALYERDCGACSSPWPLSQTFPLAPPIPLPTGATPQPTVVSDILFSCGPVPTLSLQVPGLSITPDDQSPSSDASRFAPIAAGFKRRFNRTRR
ncbi:hypothetical protein BJ165DRAFT_332292 [Panaeolus papilionaceus]|nr:hypothetical protein BJ165DRAFT_332292 [Panaeolus papilionaceus]